MRRAVLILLAPLLLSSCTGGSATSKSTPEAPSPSSTCPVDGATIPANCVDNQPTVAPPVFPDDPSRIAAVTLQEVPGKLGSADNRADASRRAAAFTVTVPKGSRIGSDVLCLGNGIVTIDTKPASKAYQSITCNADPKVPSELLAEDPTPLAATTTFRVTMTASAASRWEGAVYSTTAKPGVG